MPNFARFAKADAMSTMNIFLPETLKAFVDQQVSGKGFGTSSEYVRELIRKDQDRQNLRRLMLDGATSTQTQSVDESYFADLRDRARHSR
ncbi:ribbon-helix-helix domain-containing protein [Sphingobium sp. Ant17]|uniref:ribbon-helix-helix domain-containing protein n=1 Tax=Sphingobium sp. Ant17 TaxID=1461752 RepID=UPI00044EEECC|nr:type II toxin-antitoxin system ParD family antitoxin [Sphingobium sp. Ant17]EXS67898.1 addiction module antitoxin [Sphingobium sp. Ant17]EXS71157.1 addiction module antitoxin [Sphingobium sp. Ant17]